MIEDLKFREVSNYQEVEPGTYRVEVVAVEQSDFDENVLGQDEEAIVFSEEIEVQEGTTYTTVAYGELVRVGRGQSSMAEDGTGGMQNGDDTTTGGENGGDDSTTGGNGNDDTTTGSENGDDTTTGGGNGTDDSQTGENGTDDSQTGDDQTEQEEGEVLVEQLSFGDHEYVEVEGGDLTLEFRETQASTGEQPGDGMENGGDDTTTGGENGGDDTTTGGENGGDDTSTGGENGDENGGDDANSSENGGDDSTGGNGDDNTQNGGENGGDDSTTGSENGTDGTRPGDDQAESGGREQGFQVAVLEDQLSVTGAGMIGENGTDDPTAGNETSGNQTNGNETSGNQTNNGVNDDREVETVEDQEQDMTRVRLFHAVPDVEAVEVVAVEQDTGVFNGDPRDLDEDDINGDPFQEEQSDEQSKEASISTEGSGVYSGFALGYFDPDQAAEKQQQLLEAGTGQDGIEDGPTAGNGDDTSTGGENGGEDTTSDDTQTDQDPVSRDLIENVSDADFEVIAVEDARNGERAEGGTADDDDITLPSDLPEATSD